MNNFRFEKYYYLLKKIIPRSTQISIRRKMIQRKASQYSAVWPIDEKAARPPENWKGWPDGKKFAFIITHDVETARGLDNCRVLMDLEEIYGFRSSFNFVAGDYVIPQSLLDEMRRRGFEVGSHGLHHNGNLFQSRNVFNKHAREINQFLKKHSIVGFRCPSMYHNLDWLHELNIEYDASTFDTDPFEPQPDGAGTIFPFWVANHDGQHGYVELPYNLPQDFLLFILLQNKNIDVWKNKIYWIAANGGMALFISHPDYMSFNGASHYEKYPVKHYEDFLQYVKTQYEGQYWHVLPKDMARFWKENYRNDSSMLLLNSRRSIPKKDKQKIWIDLDNTPHIPFFKPIIDELNRRGYECFMTARDAYQVLDIADRFGLKYEKVGRHYGKNKVLKVLGTLIRSLELLPLIIKHKPAVAVSHGSRTQLVASTLLGVPTLMLIDYEHAQGLVVINPTYAMVPDVIPTASIKMPQERVSQYPGIKEDVYVVSYTPNPAIIQELKINESKIVITMRPPATEAHYFCQASEELFEASMEHILQKEDTQMILLPRNSNQQEFVRKTWSSAVQSGKIIIPAHTVNGLDLMWYSDLVISGGGTMNREATALGVPVYSIFRGTIGAVDHYLSQNGRLILLEQPSDLPSKIKLVKRDKNHSIEHGDKAALNAIVDKIEQIIT